jgi:hypothetical protein
VELVQFGAQRGGIERAREPLLHRMQVLLQILELEA